MNRFLHYFNLVGVIALAALCAAQWRVNRQANLEAISLEKARLEQVKKIEEQDRSLKGCADDLEHFREQLTRANTSVKDLEAKLAPVERSVHQLTIERDQLKTSVTNWANAVAARDEQLRKAEESLTKLAGERNEMTAKYNDLAKKYNETVDTLNSRTEQFNELVERFNKQAAQK